MEANFTGKQAPVSESSIIKLQVLKTLTLLERDSNTGFFTVNFVNYPRTPILWTNYEGLFLKHQWAFLKTSFWTEHLQWLLLKVSGFHPATLFKKRPGERCLSVNFANFLRTSFARTPPDDCFLCLSVNFEKFFRSSLL